MQSHLASNSFKLSFIFAAAGYLTRPKEGFLLFILVQGSSLHDFTAKRYCCCSARASARRAGQGLCASGRFGRWCLLGYSSAALPTSRKIKLFAAVIFFTALRIRQMESPFGCTYNVNQNSGLFIVLTAQSCEIALKIRAFWPASNPNPLLLVFPALSLWLVQ